MDVFLAAVIIWQCNGVPVDQQPSTSQNIYLAGVMSFFVWEKQEKNVAAGFSINLLCAALKKVQTKQWVFS